MAFDKQSVNGYAVATEEGLTLPDSAGAVETSVNTTSFTSDLSDKKILVQVEVTEASGGNGGLEVRVQGSLDDSSFDTLVATTGMNLDSSGLNTAVALVDLSSIQAPFYRIQVFSDGTDTVDSATLTVSYAYKLI